MTFEQIKALIDILCEKGLHELEIERSDFRVKIVGGTLYSEAPVRSPVVQQSIPAVGIGAGSTPPPSEIVTPKQGEHTIMSPIVGTFYAAASPDSDSYVQVGDRVSIGQVLCIVEAMKLMNEIESDVEGEVVQIVPANAQPVEFGEPLFVIRVES